jgi:hypothetical protein
MRTHLGMMNMYMILCRNLTATSYMVFITGIASIHLVNMSIAVNKNRNPPGALGKTFTMSIPHIVKGQERLIGRR